MKYVAYYRVSTDKQGADGLGIEAQKSIVARFAAGCEVVAHFTEVESGTKCDRPVLAEAIAQASATGATLLIAALDRLSRDAAFILTLKNSGVQFVCCDMPSANSMTIGIMAVMAQEYRDQISKKTKAALQALKDKGVALGTPANLTDYSRAKSIEVRKQAAANSEHWKRARLFAIKARESKMTLRAIANELNNNGYTTRNGKQFEAITVKRLLDSPVA